MEKLDKESMKDPPSKYMHVMVTLPRRRRLFVPRLSEVEVLLSGVIQQNKTKKKKLAWHSRYYTYYTCTSIVPISSDHTIRIGAPPVTTLVQI